jgi:hypothetical protein
MPVDHQREKQSKGLILALFVQTANMLPALLMACAILLLARPMTQAPPEVVRKAKNIQIVLDLSGSMNQPFGPQSANSEEPVLRVDAAMNAIENFIDYRSGDSFGLTIYGKAFIHWVPLTSDTSAIKYSRPFMTGFLGSTRTLTRARCVYIETNVDPRGRDGCLPRQARDLEPFGLELMAERLAETAQPSADAWACRAVSWGRSLVRRPGQSSLVSCQCGYTFSDFFIRVDKGQSHRTRPMALLGRPDHCVPCFTLMRRALGSRIGRPDSLLTRRVARTAGGRPVRSTRRSIA